MRVLLLRVFYFFIVIGFVTACGKGESVNPSQEQDTLFISLPAKDSLIVINPEQGLEVARLKLGKLPHNIRQSSDGRKIYVALVGSQAIAEIDVDTKTLIRTLLTAAVPMVDENGLVIDGHISQNAEAHATCFDCHNGKAEAARPAIVGTRPFGIALTNDNQIAVANSLDATVNFIDLESGVIARTLEVDASGDAHEPTELAIMGDKLYVTVRPTLPSYSASELRVYDLKTYELLHKAEVGPAVSDLQVDSVNNVLYVSNFESNTVEKFSSDLQLLKSLTVGNGPFGVDIDGENIRVANYYNNSISNYLDAEHNFTRDLIMDGQSFSNPTHMTRSSDEERIFLISGGTKGFLLTLNKNNMAITNSKEIDELPFDILNIRK